jgi:hypothetical protein
MFTQRGLTVERAGDAALTSDRLVTLLQLLGLVFAACMIALMVAGSVLVAALM